MDEEDDIATVSATQMFSLDMDQFSDKELAVPNCCSMRKSLLLLLALLVLTAFGFYSGATGHFIGVETAETEEAQEIERSLSRPSSASSAGVEISSPPSNAVNAVNTANALPATAKQGGTREVSGTSSEQNGRNGQNGQEQTGHQKNPDISGKLGESSTGSSSNNSSSSSAVIAAAAPAPPPSEQPRTAGGTGITGHADNTDSTDSTENTGNTDIAGEESEQQQQQQSSGSEFQTLDPLPPPSASSASSAASSSPPPSPPPPPAQVPGGTFSPDASTSSAVWHSQSIPFDGDEDGEGTHSGSVVEYVANSAYCLVIQRTNRYTPECGHVTSPRPPHSTAVVPCLITGLGRSGTTYTSHLFSAAGWNIDHDKRGQFCPCPGKHGSASHMYAFATQDGKCDPAGSPLLQHMFRRVVHQVRHPLHYINSRAFDYHTSKKARQFGQFCPWYCTQNLEFPYYEVQAAKSKGLDRVVLALYKYVLQNTFVQAYADLRIRIEQANIHPSVWERVCRVCQLGGLNRREKYRNEPGPAQCPPTSQFQQYVFSVGNNTQLNHEHIKRHGNFSWTQLFNTDPRQTVMVLLLAWEYGFPDIEEAYAEIVTSPALADKLEIQDYTDDDSVLVDLGPPSEPLEFQELVQRFRLRCGFAVEGQVGEQGITQQFVSDSGIFNHPWACRLTKAEDQ